MFHIYEGFHLVETYHKMRHQRKYHPEDSSKRVIKIALVAIVTLLLWNMPTEWYGIQNLTVIQQRIIAIFAFATLMWILEIVSSWATSIAIMVLMLLFCTDSGIMPMVNEEEVGKLLSYKGVMACFADPVIMLFIGGFVLAIAATKTGLDAQLAKVLLKPFGTKSEMVLLGFLLVTGLFSMFVSNTATAAMMLAFLAPVLRAMPEGSKDRTALALAIPIGANIGGIATPIGTPPNTIVLGYLNENLGLSISFGEWMLKMVPLVACLLFAGWILLRIMFPFTQKEIKLDITGHFHSNHQSWIVIVTFIVTIFLWCFADLLNLGLNSNIVALLPVAVFAATGVFTKHDLEEINWSVLWMVAGGFALGVALNTTKLSEVLVNSIPFDQWSPLLVMIISGLVCYGFSNFISHSAAASLLTPVLGVVAGAMVAGGTLTQGGLSQMLIGVAIAASVSMILPISTPPNAIAHSTGFIQQKDMIKVGLIIGLLGLVIGYCWMFLVF